MSCEQHLARGKEFVTANAIIASTNNDWLVK